MRIKLTSIMVDDQDKAVTFYTEVLGFTVKTDIPVGKFRWITLISPEGPNDIELALEPNENPAGRAFQKALFEQGIPATAFFTENIHEEYERLVEQGVVFRTRPTRTEGPIIAVFDDTCGNLIQIYQA